MRESMKPSQPPCSSPTQDHSLKFGLALPNPPAHPSDEYALVHQSDPEEDAMALRHGVPPPSEENGAAPFESAPANPPGVSVICWGCGQYLVLPYLSPVFKCGYCGAVTAEAVPPKQRPTRCATSAAIRDRGMVAIVVILIGALTGCGIWAILPILYPHADTWLHLHYLWIAILLFNVYFNLAMSASTQAGKVPPTKWGHLSLVAVGGLASFTFCESCKKPKPPSAHHCRQCRECVLEMDHHCPFIGNCVGAKNHRFFFVFLFWTFMACSYMFLMAVRAILQLWPKFVSLQQAAMGAHVSTLDPQHFATEPIEDYTELFTVKAFVLIYLLLLGLGTSVCLGLMISLQLQLLFDGETYVESIQGEKSERGRPFILSLLSCHIPETSKRGLQRVFGDEYPVFWMRLRLKHPPRSLANGLEDRDDHEP